MLAWAWLADDLAPTCPLPSGQWRLTSLVQHLGDLKVSASTVWGAGPESALNAGWQGNPSALWLWLCLGWLMSRRHYRQVGCADTLVVLMDDTPAGTSRGADRLQPSQSGGSTWMRSSSVVRSAWQSRSVLLLVPPMMLPRGFSPIRPLPGSLAGGTSASPLPWREGLCQRSLLYFNYQSEGRKPSRR
jgi:hypothetical protein